MRKRLYFIPYAGGAGTTFKSWKKEFDNEDELVILELPGRGSKLEEDFCETMESACYSLYEDILKKQQDDNIPYFIAGHCLGAIMTYELLYLIKEKREIKMPQRVFLSGHGAPDNLLLEDRWANLSDDELTNKIIQSGGMDESMLEPEILEMVLPIIRSDAKIYENFKFDSSRKILPIQITILFSKDDVKTNEKTLLDWKKFTRKEFEYKEFKGSH